VRQGWKNLARQTDIADLQSRKVLTQKTLLLKVHRAVRECRMTRLEKRYRPPARKVTEKVKIAESVKKGVECRNERILKFSNVGGNG
jgi:hypothetical protein